MIQLYRDQVNTLEEKIKKELSFLPFADRVRVLRMVRDSQRIIASYYEARTTLAYVAESIKVCEQLTHYR